MAISSTEDVYGVLDHARRVVGSGRRDDARVVWFVSNFTFQVEDVQVVEIISPVSTSEHIELPINMVGGVHIARPWRLSVSDRLLSSQRVEVQNLHVSTGIGPLAKPAAQDPHFGAD